MFKRLVSWLTRDDNRVSAQVINFHEYKRMREGWVDAPRWRFPNERGM